MEKNELAKEVKKRFKKKTRKWSLPVEQVYSFDYAYDCARGVLAFLEEQYPTQEERDKVKFYKLHVGVIKEGKGLFTVRLEYNY